MDTAPRRPGDRSMKRPGNTILLIEDNDDDVFVMKRVLKKMGIKNPLQVVTDGEEALNYLKGAGKYSARGKFPLPFIAFIDLKLPYIDGFEILTWMRSQSDLDPILAVMLTSSNQDRDIDRAYALGARSYLMKPPTPEDIRS